MKTVTLITVLIVSAAIAMADPSGRLDDALIGQFQSDFQTKGDHAVTVNAVTNNKINSLALNRKKLIGHNKLFNFRLKSSGITNQRSSGRCWMFAALNVVSPHVMRQLGVSRFELSEPYLAFWDKMEKANLFLESIIEMRDVPLDDRKLTILLRSPFGDGGLWHFAIDLMDKYGVVPLSAMPETKQSTSTGTVNRLANCKLRAFASELREMHQSGKSVGELRKRKEAMLSDIYKILIYCYGQPPDEFVFRYETKDSTISGSETYTPTSFYQKYVADYVPDYITLVDNPNLDYNLPYTMEDYRNMYEKPDLVMLNLPIEKLKEYCLKSLLDSQAVYFSCDIGKENFRDSGILATGIYEYNRIFDMDFKMTKAERIAYRESSPNHAMAFLGVDTSDTGQPLKWLVENSWGTDRGDKGYWYMYDEWFSEYVYRVVVDKKYVSDEDLKNFEKKPVTLPMWDPLWETLK